jgi:hypothetical protein
MEDNAAKPLALKRGLPRADGTDKFCSKCGIFLKFIPSNLRCPNAHTQSDRPCYIVSAERAMHILNQIWNIFEIYSQQSSMS